MANISILGAGAVGTALASNWSRKGHSVTLAVRDTKSVSAQSARSALGETVPVLSFKESIPTADVLVVALPWIALAEVLPTLEGLDGKIIIDATNPLGMTESGFGLVMGHTVSGGEELARLVPGARVVKSLNQIGAEIMADPSELPTPPVMFVAGDDAEARETVLSLVADLGFDAQDFGPLKGARLLEAFAMTWIHMALVKDAGRNWGFARVVSDGETS
ncbi:MAG: NAD(P)-binding domain-containing protein [Dinoroseobacter sp.]|nr:NAD(P)-binding domain-containing protein [Dinoroseobacter sp.]